MVMRPDLTGLRQSVLGGLITVQLTMIHFQIYKKKLCIYRDQS